MAQDFYGLLTARGGAELLDDDLAKLGDEIVAGDADDKGCGFHLFGDFGFGGLGEQFADAGAFDEGAFVGLEDGVELIP